MDLRIIQKTIRKYSWYKQGAAARPFYMGYPWVACARMTMGGKKISINFLPIFSRCENEFIEIYLARETLLRISDFYWKRERVRPGWLAQSHRDWTRQFAHPLERAISEGMRMHLTALTLRELSRALKEFSRVYQAFWSETIFLDGFDETSEKILDDAIAAEGIRATPETLAILSAPARLTATQREQRDLISIVSSSRNDKDLTRALERHARAFHWITNDYAKVRELPLAYFLKRAHTLASHPSEIKKEKQIIAEAQHAAARRRSFMRSHHVSRDFRAIVAALLLVSEWRDERKTLNQMGSGVLRRFVDAFAIKHGVSRDIIEYLWPWELERQTMITSELRERSKARMRGFSTVNDLRTQKNELFGAEGRALYRLLNSSTQQSGEVRGRSAHRGIVRGVARIIKTQNDFHKMKRGDILIAPNTRPEYVPIMKIAGALVSEEGGLTCHTAIVSRELKIPAIVGAQGACRAFRDGDIIEVNAEEGYVAKIGHKKN